MPENAQKKSTSHSRSAGYTRHISRPVLPGTGYSDSLLKKYHPLNDLDAERWDALGMKTWYYTTNLHRGAFMLPKYVEDLLEEEETR